MPKTKILNLVDIFKFKKDLLWGKYYYALLDQGTVVDAILYSFAYENPDLIEIHQIESYTKELLQDFTSIFALRKKIRYFIRELDEKNQIKDIEFMNACGFKRFTRNYCYEYDGAVHDTHESTQVNVFCREAYDDDIPNLVEHDIDAQILEYRDSLFRTTDYFKNNITNIFVFCNSHKPEQIHAFCCKKDENKFEFVIHPRHVSELNDFVYAFAEKFILFDKYATKFSFVINEALNQVFKDTTHGCALQSVSQILIYEGKPREKHKILVQPNAIDNLVLE